MYFQNGSHCIEVSLCFTCLWLSLELAGNFSKECESETSPCLQITDATFAVACLATLHPVGPIQAVCKERKHFLTEQAVGKIRY